MSLDGRSPGCARSPRACLAARRRRRFSDMIAQMRDIVATSWRRPRRRTSRAVSPLRSMPAAMSSSSITALPTTPREGRSRRTRCSTSAPCASRSRRHWSRSAPAAASCGSTIVWRNISPSSPAIMFAASPSASSSRTPQACCCPPTIRRGRGHFFPRAAHRHVQQLETAGRRSAGNSASTAIPATCCFSSCSSAATALRSQACSNSASSSRSA